MDRKKRFYKKGFTLIELLVVIAIIALLISIIVPALRVAKEMAAQIPCMANQKSIVLAFNLYQGDYGGKMVSASTWRTPNEMQEDARNNTGAQGRNWVACPVEETSPGVFTARRAVGMATAEFEIEGIKRGKLWPYLEVIDAYHCPADNRVSKTGVGFRSYSMVATIMDGYQSYMTQDHRVEKYSEIKNPVSKYITVEETDTEFGWNAGSWVIDLVGQYWYDPVAGWHKDGMSIGFADGHAGKIKWEDSRTKKWLQNEPIKRGNIASETIDHKDSQDLSYMLRNVPRK